MSQVVDGKFQCDACGRSFAWKPQLAGKRAKCKCGAELTVPQATAPAELSEPDDLYDFAETNAPPVPTVAPPVVQASAPSTPRAVAYRSAATAEDRRRDRFSTDNLTHPPRDVYVPAALLIIAFIALFVWAGVALDGSAIEIIVVSGIMTIVTVVKTVVLITLAMLIAPRLGISFGTFWTGVLKFAAIIIFTDVALIWLQEIMEYAGAVPTGRRNRGRMLLITLVMTAALISSLSHYLFDMDAEETGMFALPFAFISWLSGLVMMVILSAIIEAILG